jgi:cytochrome d ubiquinol oxidase subunit II
MILAYAIAVLLWISIIIYASLEGADFGGGFWDLVAFGPHKDEMHKLIKGAIGPVWEANNVWLTYLIVGLLTAFPIVIQLLTTALFIPITLVLIGVVLRGASFIFREFSRNMTVNVLWGKAFSVASILTPFLFGTIAAAVASGSLQIKHGQFPVGLIGAWLSPFAVVIGLMGLALSILLAAVYLTQEAMGRNKPELAESFRKRAFIAGFFVAALGVAGLALSTTGAPLLWQGMLNHALWAVGVTMLCGLALGVSLWLRRFILARILAVVTTGALIGTWGLAQLPYIVPPDLTVVQAASPPLTLLQLFVCALVGMSMLIPALWFLFHVFKGENIVPPIREKRVEEF